MSSPTGTPSPNPATFRIPQLNLLGLVAVCFCMVPVGFGAPWLWLIFVVPLGIAVWVVRSRTTATPDGVAARGVLRTTRVPWVDISALRLRSSWTRSRVSAVLSNGSELPLPAVRVRDLPLLAAASGGRLPDPSAAPAEPDSEQHDPESPEE